MKQKVIQMWPNYDIFVHSYELQAFRDNTFKVYGEGKNDFHDKIFYTLYQVIIAEASGLYPIADNEEAFKLKFFTIINVNGIDLIRKCEVKRDISNFTPDDITAQGDNIKKSASSPGNSSIDDFDDYKVEQVKTNPKLKSYENFYKNIKTGVLTSIVKDFFEKNLLKYFYIGHLKFNDYDDDDDDFEINDYNELINKPKINNVELIENKTLKELGLKTGMGLELDDDDTMHFQRKIVEITVSAVMQQNSLSVAIGTISQEDYSEIVQSGKNYVNFLKFENTNMSVLLGFVNIVTVSQGNVDFVFRGMGSDNKIYKAAVHNDRTVTVEELPDVGVTDYTQLTHIPTLNNIPITKNIRPNADKVIKIERVTGSQTDTAEISFDREKLFVTIETDSGQVDGSNPEYQKLLNELSAYNYSLLTIRKKVSTDQYEFYHFKERKKTTTSASEVTEWIFVNKILTDKKSSLGSLIDNELVHEKCVRFTVNKNLQSHYINISFQSFIKQIDLTLPLIKKYGSGDSVNLTFERFLINQPSPTTWQGDLTIGTDVTEQQVTLLFERGENAVYSEFIHFKAASNNSVFTLRRQFTQGNGKLVKFECTDDGNNEFVLELETGEEYYEKHKNEKPENDGTPNSVIHWGVTRTIKKRYRHLFRFTNLQSTYSTAIAITVRGTSSIYYEFISTRSTRFESGLTGLQALQAEVANLVDHSDSYYSGMKRYFFNIVGANDTIYGTVSVDGTTYTGSIFPYVFFESSSTADLWRLNTLFICSALPSSPARGGIVAFTATTMGSFEDILVTEV